MTTKPRILKQGAGAEDAIVFSMTDVEAEARGLMERARRQAGRVLAEARGILEEARTAREENRKRHQALAASVAELDRRRQEGHELGRKEGFEAGRAEGAVKGREEGRAQAYESAREQALKEARESLAEATAGTAELLEHVLVKVQAQADRLVAGAYESLLDLAVDMAALIVQERLDARPEALLGAVRSAVQETVQEGEVRVRLNPQDLEVVREYVPRLQAAFGRVQAFRLEADETLSHGDCVVRAGEGDVDARLATRLAEIRRQLKE